VEFRYRLAAQERTKLTREMHDSLLQGFAGVVYKLEAVSRQLEIDPENGLHQLEHAIEQADQTLHEARRTLMSMRLPALENRSLPEALADIGSKLSQGSAAFHLTVKGRARLLGYNEEANLFLIGREAITNAVNHANARRIQTQLEYTVSCIRMTVKDDGDGFDLSTATPREDHWGLAGMRERAADIGAGFKIESAKGKGTMVIVTLENRLRLSSSLRLLRAVRGRDTISKTQF
jgi:signal transduction histidine kinase